MTANKNVDAMSAAAALTGLSGSPDHQQLDGSSGGPTVAKSSSAEKKKEAPSGLEVSKTFPQLVSLHRCTSANGI